MDRANEEASRLKDEYISTEHLFLAILAEHDSAAARILADAGITYERFAGALLESRGGRRVTSARAENRYQDAGKVQPRPDPAWPERASWTR